MVRIDIAYEGSLRSRATHAPSSTTLVTDAPVDNHGKGESFSPTDLVATALGTCMLTLMGIVAERHEVDLGEVKVSVEKGMVAEPKRRIGKLTVVIDVPNPTDEKQRKILTKAALSCPVHASLHPEIEIPVEFRWA